MFRAFQADLGSHAILHASVGLRSGDICDITLCHKPVPSQLCLPLLVQAGDVLRSANNGLGRGGPTVESALHQVLSIPTVIGVQAVWFNGEVMRDGQMGAMVLLSAPSHAVPTVTALLIPAPVETNILCGPLT